MQRNILIISSDYTGHGHKSITEALVEQLSRLGDHKLLVVDGFSLSGNLGLRIGKLYGVITRTARELYQLIWDISCKKPSLISELTEIAIRERFLKLLKMVNPAGIIVTHPNYNGSILNILEKEKLGIPLFAIVADPITITPLWGDLRAHFTLCPTEEARQKCMEFGVPESKLKVFGFPVREKFCCHLQTAETQKSPLPPHPGAPLRCLIMSGGEGSGNMSRIARTLLRHLDCRVRIVCGRNRLLRKRLEHSLLEEYGQKVEVFGFVSDIQQLMLDSDLLFTRASPNTMMEALMCNVPLVITGALPGQEEGNPSFVEKHNLGVVCSHPSGLLPIIQQLLDDQGRRLLEIKQSQCTYRTPDSARHMAEFILDNLR